MTDNVNYSVDRATISQQKMQFDIINKHPKYTGKAKKDIREEIEKQLFEVFRKYTQSN